MSSVTDRPSAATSWCPTCRDYSLRQAGGTCSFCDQPTLPLDQAPKPKKRTGTRPRLTDQQIRACHVAHMNGHSLRSIAARIAATGLYASQGAAMEALRAGFDRLGLQARDRIEAVKRATTKHGLATRDPAKRGPGYYELRAKQRRERGETHGRICAGTRQHYPRKGEPCRMPAMDASDYCHAHDPARARDRREHLAAMRDKVGAA